MKQTSQNALTHIKNAEKYFKNSQNCAKSKTNIESQMYYYIISLMSCKKSWDLWNYAKSGNVERVKLAAIDY